MSNWFDLQEINRIDLYRYGFNGMEKDDEVSGGGNQYDYGFRIYNPRVGRFLSVDPLTKDYPWYTPYQFAGNKPITYIDLDGLEEVKYDMPNSPAFIGGKGMTKQDKDNYRKAFNRVTGNGGIAMGMGGSLFLAARIGYATYLATRATQFATTPQGQFAAMEAASFMANLFYDGPDDAFPTPGPGGELGKTLRGTSKMFKNTVFELMSGAFETNISKKVVSKIEGSVDDAFNKFKSMVGDTEISTFKNKDGREISTASLEDGTTLTFRKFSSTEDGANAVIEVNNKNVKNEGGKGLEIKFFEKQTE